MKTRTLNEFKQKDLIVKKIGIEYRKVEFSKFNSFVVEEEETYYLKKNEEYYNEVKLKVDYILRQMNEQLSKIIFNEYLINKIDNWWIYYYSKSTYYRLKNKAIDVFLEWWYV